MAMSRKKKIIIGVAAGTVLLIVVIGSILATRTDVPEVTTVVVQPKTLSSTVTSSGEVRPQQYQNITSEVQGRIEDIYVVEGQNVNKGDPLVRLDPNQLQSNTDAQLAAYQAAQNDVGVQQSQVAAANNQLSQAQQGLNVAQVAVENAR